MRAVAAFAGKVSQDLIGTITPHMHCRASSDDMTLCMCRRFQLPKDSQYVFHMSVCQQNK